MEAGGPEDGDDLVDGEQRGRRAWVRPVVMAGVGVLAVVLVLWRIGDPGDLWRTIRAADWVWVAVALAASLLTSLPFAVAFVGTTHTHVPFRSVVWLQVAMGFSNVTLPAGAESVVQIRFLQKHGVDLASAFAVAGLYSTVSEFVVQAGIFGIAAFLAPQAIDVGDVPARAIVTSLAVIGVAVAAAFAIVFGVERLRRRVVPHLHAARRATWQSVRSPRRLALIVVGNVGAQVLYAISLQTCLYAFGGGASYWTLLALWVGISVIAGLVPIPGLDSAVSTVGLSGALVAVGVDAPVAGAAVVTNTLVVAYLPAVPGWFATNRLIRRGEL